MCSYPICPQISILIRNVNHVNRVPAAADVVICAQFYAPPPRVNGSQKYPLLINTFIQGFHPDGNPPSGHQCTSGFWLAAKQGSKIVHTLPASHQKLG
jgi:hypothetical protein